MSLTTFVSGKDYVYQKIKGKSITKFSINTETIKDSKTIVYSVIDENENNEFECYPNYDVITWKYKNLKNDTSIEGKHEENMLIFSGKLKGREITKNVEIDSNPWYQDIMIPLSYIAKSEKIEIAFWLINTDDLKAYKMIATREGNERIKVNDTEVEAVNFHISVSGLPTFLWKLETWYRQEDSVFVKFYGAISGPLSSKTLIELIKE